MKRNPIHRKESKKSLILGIFIAFIMISSVFGVVFYGYSSNQPPQLYKDFKFKPTDAGYALKKDGTTYMFELLPQDSEDINFTSNVMQLIKSSSGIAMTSDYQSSYAQEIALQEYNLQQIMNSLGKQAMNGFVEESNILPTISCLNSSSQYPVVSFTESNQTLVDTIGTCIIINFDTSTNLKRAVSKIMYTLIGVIDA